MTPDQAVDIVRGALWQSLSIGMPIMLIAMAVGLLIALFQSVTQLQEMTLTFVPKIIAMIIAVIMLLPMITTSMLEFAQAIFDQIIAIGS